ETMQTGDLTYRSLLGEISDHLRKAIEAVERAGGSSLQTLIDPGIGFGKGVEDNLRLIRHLKELEGLGRPIVIGASRKSFIGHVLGGGVSERAEGTAAVVATAIMNGARIMRVHDVAAMKKVAVMTDSLLVEGT
ncbi:MAG: dihydropteroate synthase, partial [Syntrophaceae bacterium]|nr:dihydropteroate synthase [Syntrophaceae bacterium]